MGLWKVTVRSALTAGSDGSPLDRSTAVGVSTATTGTPAARAVPISSTAERTGSRRAPRTPVPSRASTTTAAFSTPLANMATSRGVGQMDLDDALVARDAVPVAGRRGTARPGIRGDDRDDHRCAGQRQAACRDEPVAPVVAGAAQDHDRAVPPPIDIGRQRADGRRDRGPGMLHQPQLRVAERLGAAVGPGHRLGRDRGQVGARGPVPTQPPQVHLEDRRVVGRQGRCGVGGGGLGCWGHGLRRVSEVRTRAGVPGAARRYEPAGCPARLGPWSAGRP